MKECSTLSPPNFSNGSSVMIIDVMTKGTVNSTGFRAGLEVRFWGLVVVQIDAVKVSETQDYLF